MAKNDPAFPSQSALMNAPGEGFTLLDEYGFRDVGLSKLEVFTLAAMMSQARYYSEDSGMAERCVNLAEACLREVEKRQNETETD